MSPTGPSVPLAGRIHAVLRCHRSRSARLPRKQEGRCISYPFYRLSDPWVDELLRMADLLLAEVAVRVEACGRYDAPEDA